MEGIGGEWVQLLLVYSFVMWKNGHNALEKRVLWSGPHKGCEAEV